MPSGYTAPVQEGEVGLAVRETSFAPAGRLYVVGAVPVENVLIP